jgi:hypothetical protein
MLLDSESGGAKGHYPNSITRKPWSGSRPSAKKFALQEIFSKPVKAAAGSEGEEEPET